MLDLKPKPFPFVVSGPSGVGKTSICRGLEERVPEIQRIVTVTTRSPRRDERQDRDYHFVDAGTFARMRDEGRLLEWAEVHGASYGTPREPVERLLGEGRIPLLNVDVQGALAIRRAIPETLLVFVLPPSEEALRARLEGRGSDDPETVRRRLQRAREEIRLVPEYDYVVVNDVLEECIGRVQAIYVAERSRVARVLPPDFPEGWA
jgi:guanylate kinase